MASRWCYFVSGSAFQAHGFYTVLLYEHITLQDMHLVAQPNLTTYNNTQTTNTRLNGSKLDVQTRYVVTQIHFILSRLSRTF